MKHSPTPLHEPFCALTTSPPTQADLIEGVAQLATTGIVEVTELVQAIHREIVLRPLGLDRPEFHALWNRGLTGQVYGLTKGIMRQSGKGLAASLRLFNRLTPAFGDHPLTPVQHFLVGVINGVAGDHLIRMQNPLAAPMLVYNRDGQVHQGPVKRRLVLMAHGLCMNFLSWDPGESVGMGEQLQYRMPDATVLYLNYNTGRRISQNGRTLSQLLERLVQENPHVEEISLIGHSMGGLVSRSALFYGKQQGHEWIHRVKNLVCLGSPHQGAVLERLGFLLQDRVGQIPVAGLLANLADIRSAGIIDLRHGSVRDDDWEHLEERRGLGDDVRKPAPLPSRINTYLVAGTIERSPDSKRRPLDIIGDYLVSIPSALGEHADPAYRLNVPEEHKAVFYGVNHMEVQYHPAVRNQVINWLVPEAFVPRNVVTSPEAGRRIEYVDL